MIIKGKKWRPPARGLFRFRPKFNRSAVVLAAALAMLASGCLQGLTGDAGGAGDFATSENKANTVNGSAEEATTISGMTEPGSGDAHTADGYPKARVVDFRFDNRSSFNLTFSWTLDPPNYEGADGIFVEVDAVTTCRCTQAPVLQDGRWHSSVSAWVAQETAVTIRVSEYIILKDDQVWTIEGQRVLWNATTVSAPGPFQLKNVKLAFPMNAVEVYGIQYGPRDSNLSIRYGETPEMLGRLRAHPPAGGQGSFTGWIMNDRPDQLVWVQAVLESAKGVTTSPVLEGRTQPVVQSVFGNASMELLLNDSSAEARAYIRWNGDIPADHVYVHIGTTPWYSDRPSVALVRDENAWLVKNLQPNTTYYYQLEYLTQQDTGENSRFTNQQEFHPKEF